MATVSNDNLLELYLNPTYLFPIVGALLSGLTVYLLGFNKTSSTPPTIQLFANGKEKKPSIVTGKKEKKRDVNSTSNAVTNSPAKSISKTQANGKLANANNKAATPVAGKKIKSAESPKNAKSSPQEKSKATVAKKNKKNATEKENEVHDEIDQMLNDTSDGEWKIVTAKEKKRKEKKDEPEKKETKKKVAEKKVADKKVAEKEVTKKEVEKKEVPKKEVPKKEAEKKEEKKEVAKKEVPKKEVPKKDGPKKEATKKETKKQ